MQIDSIYISDSRARLLVLRILDLAVLRVTNLVNASVRRIGTRDEDTRFRHAVGKLILSCLEVESNIITSNDLSGNLGIDTQKLQESIKTWQDSLGTEDAKRFQVSMSQNSYSICSDKVFAQLTTSACLRVEDLLARASTVVQGSNCTDQEKKRYLQVYGILHTVCAGVLLLVFLQHEDLIPNDDWRETVDYNKKLIAGH